jgi:hypothetical protein
MALKTRSASKNRMGEVRTVCVGSPTLVFVHAFPNASHPTEPPTIRFRFNLDSFGNQIDRSQANWLGSDTIAFQLLGRMG